MCLIYRPKKRPTFTRLCYRYRKMRGVHVEGEWRCGEYPKPTRRRAAGMEKPRAGCRTCGAEAGRNREVWENCYIQEQIDRLPEEARQFLNGGP